MPRLTTLLGAAFCAVALAAPAAASALSLELAADLSDESVEVAPGVDKPAQPIFITSEPENHHRIFIAERPGQIFFRDRDVIYNYANISSLVSCCEGERGLLSLALPPDFEVSRRVYVAYTGTTAAGGDEGDIHVDALGPGGLRQPIISWPHSNHDNHNGGQLQFGPDGHLYISTGDGGGGGDPEENGQDTGALLGKILRIDPEPGAAPPYSIPAGNPFVAGGGRPEVWAFGLRNPWRFSFDSLNGDMVIGDVGQNLHEEIDYAKSPGAGQVGGGGRNYGWNCREGFFEFEPPAEACDSLGMSAFTEPILDYPHRPPGGGGFSGCSITGGYVVRDPSLGDLYGRYVYSDFCSGGIRSLQLPSDGVGKATDDRVEDIEKPGGGQVGNPVSFGEDSCHQVYVVSSDEKVYRIAGDSPSAECSELEAPPKERPPKDPPVIPIGRPQPLPYSVRLRAKRQGNRVAFQISATPCGALDGFGFQLNRGGAKSAVKPIAVDCTTRFKLREPGRASFRAILVRGDEAVVRSEPKRVGAARRR